LNQFAASRSISAGFGWVKPDARVRGWNLHERKTMRRRDKLSHARKIDVAVASAE
jgi:hypothetical protein